MTREQKRIICRIALLAALGTILTALCVDASAYAEGFDPERYERGLAVWGAVSGVCVLFRALKWMDKQMGKEMINKDNGNKGNGNHGYRNTGDYNSGDRNTGRRNTGNGNTGNYNTGDWNTGNRNSGDRNTGYWNTGCWNTGDCNTGHGNTGNYNTGEYNTGDFNTGDFNTGDCNTGDFNTGDCNTGHGNTGDWNNGNRNTGCFNTSEQTISLFNKPSPWTYRDWNGSEAKLLLDRIPKNSVWVESDDMTDEEKAQHPTYKTTGGYLKVLDESERTAAAVNWWNGLKDKEKEIIMDIPNFDKSIFKEITGIDVDSTPPAPSQRA